MATILIIVTHYLPGHKAGGPIQTLANTVDWLGDEYQLRIVTSDRDLGDQQPYPGIVRGTWRQVGKAEVLYLAPRDRNLAVWHRLLNDINYDLLYLNSFFSTLSVKTMFLRWAGLISRRPTILAPRGQFSPGALRFKSFQKRLYLDLARRMGLYDGITWQASSDYEVRDVRALFGDRLSENGSIQVAPNLPDRQLGSFTPQKELRKKEGTARIVFLSRVARKKNLDMALELLSQVEDGEVHFDIYGPIEDAAYWKECQELIEKLGPNIEVGYQGKVDHDQVAQVFSQYHLFLFPTWGENFGHVILESLCAGCPVLISDQTPWRGLEGKNAGWDVSLSRPERFCSILDQVVAMDDAVFQEWLRGAQEFGRAFVRDNTVLDANRELFHRALED